MQRNAVRWGLLALFADGPKYGYQLRTEFDARTGGTWALNVGQLYTTLDRLDRDGLVAAAGANDDGRTVYAITEHGRVALAEWFATPVTDTDRPRSELAIKLALAATTPDVDVAAVVQTQRTESMRQMRDVTDLRRTADQDGDDLAWLLLLDHLVFALESELRWLDHVEATVLRRRRHTARPASSAADQPSAVHQPTTVRQPSAAHQPAGADETEPVR
ncbi:PadR family transcriptional regulator [Plantactinospora sp. B6F1]|uniref:helix-turn-helix transcriptional regulator n=1 Tax=Plantactinospora sp. B6F1 TaxID=3158971 RepID=UPI00102BD235